jgi:HNH endonuclease
MPQGRRDIPAQLERDVKMEAGYRCAIPSCRQHPIEIAHIVPWSKVRVHEYSNLIGLCGVCHARYDRGEIDRKAMLQYKANLGLVNARYGDYERRLLEYFATRRRMNRTTFKLAEEHGGPEAFVEQIAAQAPDKADELRRVVKPFLETGLPLVIALPFGLEFLMFKLILDGCLVKLPLWELVKLPPSQIGLVPPGGLGSPTAGSPLVEYYALTDSGVELVDRLIDASPLD